MFNREEKEADNLKAILVGLFLIALIATITILKSNSEKKPLPENNTAISKAAAIDPKKIEKISSEDLAKKIQTSPNFIVIDMRDQLSFKTEHIIDSINIPISDIASFSNVAAKNKNYVLIDENGNSTIIGAVADSLSGKGYTKLFYLDGGFADWKNKFNQTISDGDQKSFTDQAKVTYITSDNLKKLIETEKNLVIIDVRSSTLFSTGHLAGAINIPLDDLEKRRKEISLGKNIVLYDDTVLGAFKGAARLFDLGVSDTLALSDGLDSWKKKGYELAK